MVSLVLPLSVGISLVVTKCSPDEEELVKSVPLCGFRVGVGVRVWSGGITPDKL